MPRGRQHTPSVENDGSWYKMKGASGDGAIYRWETVSGQMLNDVERKRPLTVPSFAEPLPKFNHKYQSNFAEQNKFSDHDNRNSTQNFGEYFGRGLGRKLYPDIDAHRSQVDPAFWYSTSVGRRERIDTVQRRSYRHRPSNLRALTHSGTQEESPRPWTTAIPPESNFNVPAGVINQRHLQSKMFHRFPRKHGEPKKGLQKIPTDIAYPNEPFRTYLQTLCSSQEPFAKHNSWKYSYHDVKI